MKKKKLKKTKVGQHLIVALKEVSKGYKKLNFVKADPLAFWNICHPCAMKRGGHMPGTSAFVVTMTTGVCDYCVEEASKPKTLIPISDFNWPKLGKKAIWD